MFKERLKGETEEDKRMLKDGPFLNFGEIAITYV